MSSATTHDFGSEAILNFENKNPFKADTLESEEINEHYIHIRIKQRAGKKSITTVEGLGGEEAKSILSDVKKQFCCNGSLQQDEKIGTVVQLSGDQRKVLADYLVAKKKHKKENIKIHGF